MNAVDSQSNALWRPAVLATAIILPPTALFVWSGMLELSRTSAPGLMLLGIVLLLAHVLLAIWYEMRAIIMRERKLFNALAITWLACALVSALWLAQALAILYGLQEGHVHFGLFVGVAGALAYFVLVGCGLALCSRGPAGMTRTNAR